MRQKDTLKCTSFASGESGGLKARGLEVQGRIRGLTAVSAWKLPATKDPDSQTRGRASGLNEGKAPTAKTGWEGGLIPHLAGVALSFHKRLKYRPVHFAQNPAPTMAL